MKATLTKDIMVAWDPSPDPITSYSVFWAEKSVISNPSQSKSVGKALEATIPELLIGHRYYFAVKAYYYNNESGFSNEINWLIPDNNTIPRVPVLIFR